MKYFYLLILTSSLRGTACHYSHFTGEKTDYRIYQNNVIPLFTGCKQWGRGTSTALVVKTLMRYPTGQSSWRRPWTLNMKSTSSLNNSSFFFFFFFCLLGPHLQHMQREHTAASHSRSHSRSHSHAGSEACLRPTPQLTATEQGQESNLQPHDP